MNIWQQLKQNGPIFVMAPMEDVTDTAFRQVLVKAGPPDLFYTEFTNVEGLCSKGRTQVAHRLLHTDAEQPLIAQIWGSQPQHFYTVAQELAAAGFAGIDINMGCPDRSVVRRGQCSGLINNPTLAAEIIAATKQGAGPLPVSVKTRCGLSDWRTEEWLGFLLQQQPDALIVHGRIAKEMSHFPARWEEIAKAVPLRDQLSPHTILIGNGDVASYQDGLDKVQQTGIDGVMVGRGIFKNPWLFNPQINPDSVDLNTRVELLTYHLQLFKDWWVLNGKANGKLKNYNLLKKFFKVYLSGSDQALALKDQLMQTTNVDQALKIVNSVHS